MSETSRISREDVVKVARLARLDLSDGEIDVLTGELDAILDHAAAVSALDTSGVEPTAHPMALFNVLRDDAVEASLDRDVVLAQAPAAEDGFFLVPRILDEAT
jgi:aspartyl-tRNA(Asn)/glutamyl-tRNA(Gln) amidotransferase subunit C